MSQVVPAHLGKSKDDQGKDGTNKAGGSYKGDY